jgi:hypothetical protein
MTKAYRELTPKTPAAVLCVQQGHLPYTDGSDYRIETEIRVKGNAATIAIKHGCDIVEIDGAQWCVIRDSIDAALDWIRERKDAQ